MSKHILIVEDDKNISDVISAYLKKNHFKTSQVFNGQEAMSIIEEENFDLIILDLMLPMVSGEEICRHIRLTSNVPIIMLTAKVQEEDLLKGFDLGADDYIKKPFSPRELVKRVQALLKHSRTDQDKLSINQGELILNFSKMTLTQNGKNISLTPNEFKVLEVLTVNINQVLSRDQIISQAFGLNYDGYDRTIDTHIKNLRHKLGDKKTPYKYIQTIYGIGYQFLGELS